MKVLGLAVKVLGLEVKVLGLEVKVLGLLEIKELGLINLFTHIYCSCGSWKGFGLILQGSYL